MLVFFSGYCARIVPKPAPITARIFKPATGSIMYRDADKYRKNYIRLNSDYVHSLEKLSLICVLCRIVKTKDVLQCKTINVIAIYFKAIISKQKLCFNLLCNLAKYKLQKYKQFLLGNGSRGIGRRRWWILWSIIGRCNRLLLWHRRILAKVGRLVSNSCCGCRLCRLIGGTRYLINGLTSNDVGRVGCIRVSVDGNRDFGGFRIS